MQTNYSIIFINRIIDSGIAFNALLGYGLLVIILIGQYNRLQVFKKIALGAFNSNNNRLTFCRICNRKGQTGFCCLVIGELYFLCLIACGNDFQRSFANCECFLFESNGIAINSVVIAAQLAPVTIQIQCSNLAEIIRTVFKGQSNIAALVCIGNCRSDEIQLTGYIAVLNIAQQTVFQYSLGSTRRIGGYSIAGSAVVTKRNPQLAFRRNLIIVVRTAEIPGIAGIKCRVQRRGFICPVFIYSTGSRSALVQIIQHAGICNQIALKQEIGRNSVSAAGAGGAAGRRTAGCAADCVQRDGSLRNRSKTAVNSKFLAEGLEAVCLNGQLVAAAVLQKVSAVFSGFIIIQYKQILTPQEIINGVIIILQFNGILCAVCTDRTAQRYLFNRVGNTIHQITYFKMQVFAGLRRFLQVSWGSASFTT